MLSILFSFVLGFLAAIGGLIFLLFQWNPNGRIDELFQSRRRKKRLQHLQNSRNPFEQRQHQLFQLTAQSVETVTWINTISGYLFDHLSNLVNQTAADGRLEEHINSKILSKINFPHFVRPVVVSDLSIGSSLPTIETVNIIQADTNLPIVFDVRLRYGGSAYICVESGVGAFPLAVLPVELALKSISFDFTFRVELDVSRLPVMQVTCSILASHPMPTIDFELHSHIGAALVLSDLNILQTVIQRTLQEVMEQEIIQPNAIQFEIKLWE